ncbi:22091_t:CDS:2, partial [Racocetra persica]
IVIDQYLIIVDLQNQINELKGLIVSLGRSKQGEIEQSDDSDNIANSSKAIRYDSSRNITKKVAKSNHIQVRSDSSDQSNSDHNDNISYSPSSSPYRQYLHYQDMDRELQNTLRVLNKKTFLVVDSVLYHIIHEKYQHGREEHTNQERETEWINQEIKRKYT